MWRAGVIVESHSAVPQPGEYHYLRLRADSSTTRVRSVCALTVYSSPEQVLQGPVDKELHLYEPNDNPDKEKRTPIAVLTMGSLSTQPVEESGKNMSITERFSDDDSEDSSEVSDVDENRRRRSLRKTNRRGGYRRRHFI